MSAKVVFLPGIMGSELYRIRPPAAMRPDQKIWINPVELIGRGYADLQLGVDGVSPGPMAGGAQIAHGIPLPQHYWPLLHVLQAAGYTVLARGFDWRLSVFAVANALWAELEPVVGSDPLYLVCHSLGGLVARALYQVMQARGVADQVARIITIGTPHYGSWATALVWWHASAYYRWAVQLSIAATLPIVLLAIDWLDAVMATMPSMYELMPFRASGPLATQYPAQAAAIYQQATYAPPANPYVSALRLAEASDSQDVLADLPPAGLVDSIMGTGYPTAVAQGPGGSPWLESTYITTTSGDGTVTTDQASLSGATYYQLAGRHELLPQLPLVQQLVLALLAAGPATRAASTIHAAGIAPAHPAA